MSNTTEDKPKDNKLVCDLDTWYQMLSILYMLLVYCEIVVCLIFGCSFFSYMKRFFLITDEIPFSEQRLLPVSQGGRGHPLIRRTFNEYQSAFDYALFIISRGRINRNTELRYLQNYKNKQRQSQLRHRIKTLTYKCEDIHTMRDSLSSQISSDTESSQDEEKKLTRVQKMQQLYKKAKSFKIKNRANTEVGEAS